MKKALSLLFISILILVGIGCKKSGETSNDKLQGSWKMIHVIDKSSKVITNDPGNKGEVRITFVPNGATTGKIVGRTPSNDIFGLYTIGQGKEITAPEIGGSKTGENSWGILFYANMTTIKAATFDGNDLLNLETDKKVLAFKRL